MTKKWLARPQTARDRISNPVSGGQCHLTNLRRLQCSLYVHKSDLKLDSFHFFTAIHNFQVAKKIPIFVYLRPNICKSNVQALIDMCLSSNMVRQ